MYWGDQKKKCPPLKKNFFVTKSAVEIASMIKNKELTSYEVVNGFINRIIEVLFRYNVRCFNEIDNV